MDINEQNFEQQSNPAPVSEGKGFSVAALVLGIIGIVGSFITIVCYFALPCAILGIVFGVKGRRRSTLVRGKSSGLATAGLVLGIIGTVFAALGLICTLACAGMIAGILGTV